MELAQALFLSRSQLYRKIKALTDNSTSIYIRLVRLREARKLLANTKLTISEIACLVGFIAQEVERAAAQAEFEFSVVVKPDHDHDHYSLRYAEFVVPLKGMQEQQEVIEKQEKEQLAQQQKIKQLERDVIELKALVQQLLDNRQDQTPVQSYELTTKLPARLAQNYPNLFHENTLIEYSIPAAAQNARLEIHRMDGKLLETILIQNTGTGRINIRAGSYPGRTHLYSLLLDEKVIETKQMILTPH